jgi:hypothetical protein
MDRQVFEPLAMERTVVAETEGLDGVAHAGRRPDYSCVAGGGAFLSTPTDLVRLGSAMAGAMITLMPGSQPELPFHFLMAVADRNGAFTVGGVLPGDYFVIAYPSAESSFGGFVSAFSIGFGVETVAGSEPVVVFETPSERQPVKIHVMDANVPGLRVVATPN